MSSLKEISLLLSQVSHFLTLGFYHINSPVMGLEDERNPEVQARERSKRGEPFRGALAGAADWAGLGGMASGSWWQVLWRGQREAVQRWPACLTAGDCRLAEALCWGLVTPPPSQRVSLPETSREPVSPAGRSMGCCCVFSAGAHTP